MNNEAVCRIIEDYNRKDTQKVEIWFDDPDSTTHWTLLTISKYPPTYRMKAETIECDFETDDSRIVTQIFPISSITRVVVTKSPEAAGKRRSMAIVTA